MAGKIIKKKYNGSFTVEMALLSGIWLLVIFSSLFLIAGTYSRVRDTAALAEASAYGSTSAVYKTGDGIQATAQRLKDKGNYFSVSGSKREITASFSHTVKLPFRNLRWQQNEVLKSKVIRPVLFIEKVEKARNVIEAIKAP